MADSEKAQSFYYSAHHLARDLFWNAANFGLFLVLGAVLNKNFRDDIWLVISKFAELDSPAIQIAGCIAFLALGAVLGIIATQIYISLTWVLSYIPILRNFNYDGWYHRDAKEIRDLYDRVFGKNSELLLRSKPKPMDLDVRLTSYMRLYNPSGYVHVFRTYSIVALFRQAIIYTSVILVWSVQGRTEATPPGILVLAILVLLLAQREAIEYSVAREYAFMLATLQWIENQNPLLARGSDAAANTGLKRTAGAAA